MCLSEEMGIVGEVVIPDIPPREGYVPTLPREGMERPDERPCGWWDWCDWDAKDA